MLQNHPQKSVSHSVVSNSLRPYRLRPARLLVHGILQARILEWVAIPLSRGSSQSRDWSQVSCIAGGFFTIWATREVPGNCSTCYWFHRAFLRMKWVNTYLVLRERQTQKKPLLVPNFSYFTPCSWEYYLFHKNWLTPNVRLALCWIMKLNLSGEN